MATPDWIRSFPAPEMRLELEREWQRLEALHPEQTKRSTPGIEGEPRPNWENAPGTCRRRRVRRETAIGLLLGLAIGVGLVLALAAV